MGKFSQIKKLFLVFILSGKFYEIRQISIVPSKFYSFYNMHVKHVFNINLYINCAVESGYGSLFLLDIVDGCIYKLKVGWEEGKNVSMKFNF